MNFIEAVEAMRKGKRVRIPGRDTTKKDSCVLPIQFEGCTSYYMNDYYDSPGTFNDYKLYASDYLSDDWEIVED